MSQLQQYIDEGRLIRRAWTGTDEQGRHTACLLAALAPVCGEKEDAGACPADVMPAWLAYLTPWMDDSGTDEVWPAMVRRYAAVSQRWRVLTPEQWQRCEWLVKIACIEEALRHVTVDEWGVRAACEQSIDVFRRAGETGSVDAAASWAAAAASWAAELAAVSAAARAAARAAELAARAAWAAELAAELAARAARAAESAAAVDRLTAAILTIIESACDEAEVSR